MLVIPYRPVSRLTDLSAAEVSDLFTTVQKVQRMLARLYFKDDKADGKTVGKLEDGRYGSSY